MPIAARATATRNWINQPVSKMSARIPPSRLAAIPTSAVASRLICCWPGSTSRPSPPMMRPVITSQRSSNTSPTSAPASSKARTIAIRMTTMPTFATLDEPRVSRGASVDVVADTSLEQRADAAWIPRHQRIRLVERDPTALHDGLARLRMRVAICARAEHGEQVVCPVYPLAQGEQLADLDVESCFLARFTCCRLDQRFSRVATAAG